MPRALDVIPLRSHLGVGERRLPDTEERPVVEKRPFGWTGFPVPAIGQGTWMMERVRANAAAAALRLAPEELAAIDRAFPVGRGAIPVI